LAVEDGGNAVLGNNGTDDGQMDVWSESQEQNIK